MTITLIILSVVFSVIAHALGCISGYAKMICDLSEESKLNKTPYEYWHKHLSSKNKYEYTGKIKQWLMKNLLVMFTDGWHKYQFVLNYLLISFRLLCRFYFRQNNTLLFIHVAVCLLCKNGDISSIIHI
jgi:hypothetical protein